MCGIVGVIDLEPGPARVGLLDRMLAAVAHRGPDGIGTFAEPGIELGHRRLSILDPTEAGAQPMARHDAVLVHNGEIYNFLELAEELRAKGYRFTSHTDTEVILAAYDAWGPSAVARFNGMWALALWDRGRRRLLLSRDRLGVKPLYYRVGSRTVLFASEVAALVAAGAAGDGWRPEPQLTAIRDFLVRGLSDHSELTFIEGIRSLPAGGSLLIEDRRLRHERYWSAPVLTDDARPVVTGEDRRRDHDRVEELRALVDDSIRLRLRSDVPIGTCLSGGLDSSSIVVTASVILEQPRPSASVDASSVEKSPRWAFHARFPDHGVDESRYADLVAATSRLEVVYTSPTMGPLLATIQPVLRAQGEPFAGLSVFAQFAVMESARSKDVKVLLDGQGADELLAGYLPYLGYRAASLLEAGAIRAVMPELRAQVAFGSIGPRSALSGTLRALAPSPLVELARSATRGPHGLRLSGDLSRSPTAARHHREPGTLLARRLWQDVCSDSLPALLRYEDRNSMAFGIEARVPFLDYRLVEFAAALPDRLKIAGGVTKAILRRAMTDRLPEPVLGRRDKVGFAAPQERWLAEGREEIRRYLLPGGQIVDRGWMRTSDVRRVITASMRDGAARELLWRMFVTEAWLNEGWPAVARPPAARGG